jgi:ABC-type uncharacterized transport system substrate-binding protein
MVCLWETLASIYSRLERVAVLWNFDSPQIVRVVESLRKVAQALGLEISVFPARPTNLEVTFAAIPNARLAGLVVTDDSSTDAHLPKIVEFATEHRLPAINPFSTAVQRGGLMSYSAYRLPLGMDQIRRAFQCVGKCQAEESSNSCDYIAGTLSQAEAPRREAQPYRPQLAPHHGGTGS